MNKRIIAALIAASGLVALTCSPLISTPRC